MADIFVSYASEDRDRVRTLVELLEARGFSVWWDRDLYAGPQYTKVIESELEVASAVIVAWSQKAIDSPWVFDEANVARKRGVLVPLLIEDVQPPIGFRAMQTAELKQFPMSHDGIDMLLRGIEELVGSRIPAPPAASIRVGFEERAVAVLPFANLSSDPEQAYFSDGITEDLIDRMVKSLNLKVIGQASSFRLKDHSLNVADIGKRLGVTHLVQGSVRRSGDRVRINAQLVCASDGATEWSDQYTRQLDDVFAVQDEITAEIASALQTTLLGVARSAKIPPPAQEEYLRGKACLRRFSTTDAADAFRHFERAIEYAPDFPDAYGQAAHAALSRQGSNASMRSQARIALLDQANSLAEEALALDPAQPDALASKVRILYQRQWRHAEALDLLQQTLSRYPGHTTLLYVASHALASICHWDALLGITKHWKDVDPLSVEAHFWNAMAGFAGGDDVHLYIEEVESGLAIQPGNGLLIGMIGHLLLEEGLIDQARHLAADFPQSLVPLYVDIAMGDASALREWMRKFAGMEGGYSYHLMYLHWWFGEEDAAREHLWAALDGRHPHIINWHSMWRYATRNNDRKFTDFYSDPKCQAILARSGQDQASLQILRNRWSAT